MKKFKKEKSNSSGDEERRSICNIPEISKIQLDTDEKNVYVLIFLSNSSIYQRYITTHSFEFSKSKKKELYSITSYYFHTNTFKTLKQYFDYDICLETEIKSNEKEYVVVGWIIQKSLIVGIIYVKMNNTISDNYNVLILDNCPYICFLGSITSSFYGLFLNNIRFIK